jgi:RNA-directed DNA polymerase
VRARVAEAALKAVIEPIFECAFAATSYGWRPGRGCQDAWARVEGLLPEGLTWVVEADWKSYFDSIPQDRLLARLGARIADGAVRTLVEDRLPRGVMNSRKGWEPTRSGTPPGSVVSPL